MSSRLAAALLALLVACTADHPAAPPATAAPPPSAGGSTPRALAVLGQGVVTARYTAEVTVRPVAGDYAYTSSWGTRAARGNVVYVWDVRADRPVLTDTLVIDASVAPGVSTTGDLQVTDDDRYLVVATESTGSLVVYSLADPAHPRLLKSYTSPDIAGGVHTAQLARVNGTLYAFCAIDPRANAPAHLVILDLSDPANPRQVWTQTMGEPFVHDVYVRDGALLTANWNEGVVVWDLGGLGRGGTVAAPRRIGAARTVPSDGANPSVHNVWWLRQGGVTRYALVGEELTTGGTIGNSSAGDVHVLDLADLANPATWREVATYRVAGSGVHNFSLDEARGILYAAYYDGGVRALDVRGDLGTCTATQRTADGRCDLEKMGRAVGVALSKAPTTTDPRTGTAYAPFVWGVEYRDGVVYASDMLGGLWKLRGLTP